MASALAALAAVILTFFCVSLFVRDTHNVEYYATGVGEQRSILLPDGSVITLNTDSDMTLRRDGTSLYVALLRGEAHFNMVPGKPRRLVVSVADQVEVIDTATIFDVRLTEHGARITVKEGHVEISVTHLAQVQLIQNQQATLDTGPTSLAVRTRSVSSRDVARQLAWLQGYLDFQCEPLASAASEFNRYNLTHIEIMDEPTKHVQIGGMFSIADPVTFAEAIAQVMPNVELVSARGPNGTRILRLRQELHSRATPNPGCSSHPSSDN
jgi:transmembrane sensor